MIETYITYSILVILGAMFGSFSAATVWRLRYSQLESEKRHGEKVSEKDSKEVNNLQRRSIVSDRSVCLGCGRQLDWWELIPIISWLALRGKCRTCKKKIGVADFYAEIGLATAFAVSYAFWPYPLKTGFEQGLFVVWLFVLILLLIHFMYDYRWHLLLDKITLILLGASVVYAILYINSFNISLLDYLVQVSMVALILPIFYGLLCYFSKGEWVGLGDVKLLVPFSVMLTSWEYGLILLFLANLIGLLVVAPGLISGKLNKKTKVAFGPFLIIAFVLTILFGGAIVKYYVGSFMY